MIVKTVILVVALVIANSNAKVILTDENLPDPSINIISKDDTETYLQVTTDLPTSTKFNINSKISTTESDMDNFIDDNDNLNDTKSDNIDDSNKSPEAGVALLLTPLIEDGFVEEARNACRVDPSLFLGIESYSGFFTVNKTHNSNVFFWYFPVQNKLVNETPWIVWLQGGPGASSLAGLFDEIGPFRATSDDTLIKDPYTWLQNHSLVFVDNPVGAGFSFTEHADGFVKDMATYSNHLFSTIQQFLQVFPELRMAPLFVAGESYAGKYVPALAMELHRHKSNPGQEINLQGLIVGNGYVDPAMIAQITKIFYNFGLLDKEELDIIDPLAKAFQRDIANNNSLGAKNKWTSLISVLLFLSHQKQAYNFLKDEIPFGLFSTFLNRTEIKKAIHVGEHQFSFVNLTTNLKMAPDFLSSAKPLFEELLEHYRVLTYCGQLDQMLPCVSTSENYRTWKWNGTSEFLAATRYPFMYNNRLAGAEKICGKNGQVKVPMCPEYCKTGGNLTEVVVRGAGHMVPMDQPAAARELVARWTHGAPLARRSRLLESKFVKQFVANYSAIYV